MNAQKIFSMLMLTGVLCSCGASNLIRLNDEVDTLSQVDRYLSNLPDGIQRASIGDDLFRISRVVSKGSGEIRIMAQTSQPFPKNSVWKSTHIFKSRHGGEYRVYTSADYYDGVLGVIIDQNGHVFPEIKTIDGGYALVIVSGHRAGRLYRVTGQGRFLDRVLVDYWGLRYGGVSDGVYLFDIVNRNESNTGEVLQNISISQQDFLEGVTIRDVLIQGVSEARQGVISFTVKDLLSEVN